MHELASWIHRIWRSHLCVMVIDHGGWSIYLRPDYALRSYARVSVVEVLKMIRLLLSQGIIAVSRRF
jgi:hypothetical protein